MRIKRLLLILGLFVLSGCTINYNLEIKNDEIIESISGNVSKEEAEVKESDTGLNIYYEALHSDHKPILEGNDFYTKEISEDKDKINYNATYTYSIENYSKSQILNTCFGSVDIADNDSYYAINLKGPFTCLYSDKVYINVTSENMVIEHNASSVKNNTYSWVIDNHNSYDDIFLSIAKNAPYKSSSGNVYPNVFQIVTFVILIILSGVTYFLYYKINKRNAQS